VLQCRQLLDHRRVLRPVRLHLLDHPVLPARPRLQPLSADLRTLPFALGVGAAAPTAPVFARRLGTKIVVPAGLILMGAGFLIASTLGSNTAYFGPVLASMVLMAVGLGLVTAPSTGAILAVLPLGKAGSARRSTTSPVSSAEPGGTGRRRRKSWTRAVPGSAPGDRPHVVIRAGCGESGLVRRRSRSPG
jgi:hypothetical protein